MISIANTDPKSKKSFIVEFNSIDNKRDYVIKENQFCSKIHAKFRGAHTKEEIDFYRNKLYECRMEFFELNKNLQDKEIA